MHARSKLLWRPSATLFVDLSHPTHLKRRWKRDGEGRHVALATLLRALLRDGNQDDSEAFSTSQCKQLLIVFNHMSQGLLNQSQLPSHNRSSGHPLLRPCPPLKARASHTFDYRDDVSQSAASRRSAHDESKLSEPLAAMWSRERRCEDTLHTQHQTVWPTASRVTSRASLSSSTSWRALASQQGRRSQSAVKAHS